MASGLAIVAYRYAAARQHLRPLGALLAPFRERGAFVEAAQELAADPRLREHSRDGAAEAARALSWASVLDDLEAILADLVTQSRGARVTTAGAGAPRIAETDHAPL